MQSSERHPTEDRTLRMGTLAQLPVFLKLADTRAVVAGDGTSVAWKAELLAAAGARVDVFAPQPGPELLALAAQPPGGTITLHSRPWCSDDLVGARIAVLGCDDDGEAERFVAAARTAGVPVNVIDKPAHCDFSFGAIVNRSPLVIGISTDGAAPVLAQVIRGRLEAMIPRGFARWADAARRWRRALRARGLSSAARRRFWRLFARLAETKVSREPQESDFERLIADAGPERAAESQGSVTLVGAGPGDPELLTLQGLRALQGADVILIDDLVAPELLDFARREAKKMLVGKTGAAPSCKQDEINALMVKLAKGGRRVVRLKGGDPMIFARASEEIAACRAAGIAVEIVPGITAAQAVAARVQVPLTQRGGARRLQYISGHMEEARLPDDIDWRSLADPATTTVVYMPKRTLSELTARAVTAGLAPETPAVAVAAATRPEETVITGTVATIAARLAESRPNGPVSVFIGRLFGEVAVAPDSDTIPEKLPRVCCE
ncbi:MAG: siroheme synthase CysG [Xanthobacteraceae bacterium]